MSDVRLASRRINVTPKWANRPWASALLSGGLAEPSGPALAAKPDFVKPGLLVGTKRRPCLGPPGSPVRPETGTANSSEEANGARSAPHAPTPPVRRPATARTLPAIGRNFAEPHTGSGAALPERPWARKAAPQLGSIRFIFSPDSCRWRVGELARARGAHLRHIATRLDF